MSYHYTDMSNFRQLADFRLFCLVLGHSCESSRSGLISCTCRVVFLKLVYCIGDKSYLTTQTVSTFNFKLIDNATTMRYLSNLNPSHSCGHDNLSTVTLKYIANEIS